MTLLSDAMARLLTLSELLDAHTHARTELVKVSDVIVKALIEHLPADSSALVDQATYRVERVTWPLYETRDTPAFPHPFGSYPLLRDEIVLADVRTTIIKGAKATSASWAAATPGWPAGPPASPAWSATPRSSTTCPWPPRTTS